MKRCLAVMVLGAASWWVSAIDAVDATSIRSRDIAEAVQPPVRASDQHNAILLALKQNDFAALLEAMEEDKDLAQIADEWDAHAKQVRADAQDAAVHDSVVAADDDMQQVWDKLQTDDGVDALVAEWQPKLAEEQSARMMEFNLGFGALLAKIASDESLSADQVQQLTRLMYAVQDWSGRVDFADTNRLRMAVNAIAGLARQTRLKRFDDIRTLSFEDVTVHGDQLMRTVKRVLAAYDLDADAILNSVRIEERDVQGDRATLHFEARVLGVELTRDQPMRYFRDRWMDAELADDMVRWETSPGVPAAAAEEVTP